MTNKRDYYADCMQILHRGYDVEKLTDIEKETFKGYLEEYGSMKQTEEQRNLFKWIVRVSSYGLFNLEMVADDEQKRIALELLKHPEEARSPGNIQLATDGVQKNFDAHEEKVTKFNTGLAAIQEAQEKRGDKSPIPENAGNRLMSEMKETVTVDGTDFFFSLSVGKNDTVIKCMVADGLVDNFEVKATDLALVTDTKAYIAETINNYQKERPALIEKRQNYNTDRSQKFSNRLGQLHDVRNGVEVAYDLPREREQIDRMRNSLLLSARMTSHQLEAVEGGKVADNGNSA